jgi:hypothetical protein
MPLAPEAKRLWVAFINEHGAEQEALSGDLAACWSKLEAYAARLALVLHFVAWAGGSADADAIGADSIRRGVELVRWFGQEATRIYGMFGESDAERESRRLVEWIINRGGAVTVRDVLTGNRRFHTSDEAEHAVIELVEAGLGNWDPIEPSEKGGRPTRVFRLSPPSASAQPQESP